MADTVIWEDADATVHRVVVGPMVNNVYALVDRGTGASLLVDAADEPDVLLELCSRLGVRRAVITHGHGDHIQAVPQLRRAGVEIAVSGADADRLPAHDLVLEDDTHLQVGRLQVRVLATPGHTPGSMCFHIGSSDVLFTGDTLFPGGPGNTQGSGGDFPTIIESIQGRIFGPMPDRTLVLPGHGAETTVGTERPHVQEWIDRGW